MPRKTSSSSSSLFDAKSNVSSIIHGTLNRIGSLRRSFRKTKPAYTSKYDQQNLRYLDISAPRTTASLGREPEFRPARIFPARNEPIPVRIEPVNPVNEVNIDEAFDFRKLRTKTEEIYGIIQPNRTNSASSTLTRQEGFVGGRTSHQQMNGSTCQQQPSRASLRISNKSQHLQCSPHHHFDPRATPSVHSEYSASDIYDTLPRNRHSSSSSFATSSVSTSLAPASGNASSRGLQQQAVQENELSEFSDTNSLLSSDLSMIHHNGSQHQQVDRVNHEQPKEAAKTGVSSEMITIMQHLQSKYPNYDIVNNYQSRASKSKSSSKSDQQQQQQTSSQQQQTSKSASTNGPPPRSASTTPMDRNFYAFQAVQQPSSSLFDEDPGIMSEIETSATGFRRGGKIRSSLPVVRTPSKSQDRSMGLIFLQFRSETKRALLPNEITSLDTVKALFVRSFPRQLSMNILEHPTVRIYIHDPTKDMFYELEDLRDVKDRAILRIYEKGVAGPQPGEGAATMPHNVESHTGPDNFGYFSEPEFDSDFQSQHIHRKRPFPLPMGATAAGFAHPSLSATLGPHPQSQYYGTIMVPPQFRQMGIRPGFLPGASSSGPPPPPARGKAFPGYSQTLPRGTHLMSPTSAIATNGPINHFTIASQQQPPPKPQRSFVGQNGPGIYVIQRPPMAPPGSMPPPPSVSPGPQQQQQQNAYNAGRPLPDRPYSVTGNYPSPDRLGRGSIVMGPGGGQMSGGAYPQPDISGYLSSPEHRPSGMLTNMPQQRASFSAYPTGPRFEDMAFQPINVYPNRMSAQAPPPSSAVENVDARFRMQEMERQIASLANVVNKALTTPGAKPPPPPKPASLMSGYKPDVMNGDESLRSVRKQTADLRTDVRNLRRAAVQHTNQTNEMVNDGLNKIKESIDYITKTSDAPLRMERLKISHDRDAYTDDVKKLDTDLQELESQVEELRSNVINRRCRVNVSNVESMAMVLSRASKTVSDLKVRYPSLAKDMKSIMTKELQQIEQEEKLLKEEPDRLEQSLKRCKKLTGTLVTLKRLASVQEQRSSGNNSTCSPSQLRDGSGDELSASGPRSTHDPLTRVDTKRANWRRSVHFHRPVSNNKLKIEYCLEPMVALITNGANKSGSKATNYRLCRGFTSMPTIQDDEYEVDGGRVQQQQQQQQDKSAKTQRRQIERSKSSCSELLEPHTVIQVTPATPSSTDSSKTATILENLFDELQSFSKQSSIDSTAPPFQRSSGSLRGKHQPMTSDSLRKASRSKSYSSLRANSESPGARSRGASLADGTVDLEAIAMLASKCGQSAAATAALVEKRFAQSRQELLEQRHQELLRKQKQLQEQYTRLQQLSRGQMSRQLGDLKKTGSESNLRTMVDSQMVNFSSKPKRMSSASVHGSLKNLARDSGSSKQQSARVADSNPEPIPKKVYETDIL